MDRLMGLALPWLQQVRSGRGTIGGAVLGAAPSRNGPTLSVPVLTGLFRASELGLIALATVVTGVLLRRVSNVPPWGEFIVVSLIAIAVARAAAEHQKIYSLPALLDPLAHLLQLGLCFASGTVASMATLLLLHDHVPDLPYLVTQPVSWFLASGAAALGFRAVVAWRLQSHAKAGRLSTRTALIGASEASLTFIREAARDPRIRIVGLYDDDAITPPLDGETAGWLRGNVGDLVTLARHEPVDAIVIVLPSADGARIADMRGRLAGIAADVFLATDTPDPLCAGAQLTMFGPIAVLPVSSRPLKDWSAFNKAAFDRVASAAFLVFALPVMAVVTLLVKVESKGPVLFRQEREGLNGLPFTMLKFRTMFCRDDNDESVQATAGDRRVTRIGYWLRRYSLDELPQLWNVLRGDMSLVGPRPHLATTRAGNRLFRDVVPHYQARHRMKPGLTGWAQVNGFRGETRTERELVERIAKDLYYIENWSLGLDLRILGRTLLREIISSSGKAY